MRAWAAAAADFSSSNALLGGLLSDDGEVVGVTTGLVWS